MHLRRRSRVPTRKQPSSPLLQMSRSTSTSTGRIYKTPDKKRPYGSHTALISGRFIFHTAWSNKKLLDRKSTRLNSSHVAISYAVFCLKKKKDNCYTKTSGHNTAMYMKNRTAT